MVTTTEATLTTAENDLIDQELLVSFDPPDEPATQATTTMEGDDTTADNGDDASNQNTEDTEDVEEEAPAETGDTARVLLVQS